MQKKIMTIGLMLILVTSGIASFPVMSNDDFESNQLNENNVDNENKHEEKGLIFSLSLYFIRGSISGYSIENGMYTFNCIDVKVDRFVGMFFIIIPLIIEKDSFRFQNEEYSPRYANRFRGILTDTYVFGILIGIG